MCSRAASAIISTRWSTCCSACVLLKERLTRAQVFAVPARRRRRRGARRGRRLGPVDQPDARRSASPPTASCARSRRSTRSRGCGSRPRSWRRSRWAGSLWLQQQRRRPASASSALAIDLLLVLGGAVTATPLLLFTAAAKRLPYSTLGFLQYIAPSLQFLLAVLVVRRAVHAAPTRSASARSGRRSPSSASRGCAPPGPRAAMP